MRTARRAKRHCYELPMASVVRNYIKATGENTLSLSYDRDGTRYVDFVDSEGVIYRYSIDKKKPFAEVMMIIKNGDVLEDYGNREEVHLDAVSLVRVLAWATLNGSDCPEYTYKVAGDNRIDTSITEYVEGYSRSKEPLQRLQLARGYVLDALGSLLVLLDLENEEAEDLATRDEATKILADPKATAAELIRVGTEIHLIARRYVDTYTPPENREETNSEEDSQRTETA